MGGSLAHTAPDAALLARGVCANQDRARYGVAFMVCVSRYCGGRGLSTSDGVKDCSRECGKGEEEWW